MAVTVIPNYINRAGRFLLGLQRQGYIDNPAAFVSRSVIQSKGNVVVTYMEIVTAIRQLAAEMPDFVYKKPDGADNCSNLNGGCEKYPDHTGCIVGQAVRRCGLNVPSEHEFNSARVLISDQTMDVDSHAVAWISVAQGSQDNGDSWQEAVERADIAYPNILARQQSSLATKESK